MVRIQKIVFIIVVFVVILGVGLNIYDRSKTFVRSAGNVQHILLSSVCASGIVRRLIQCPLGSRIRIFNDNNHFRIVLNNVDYLNMLTDAYVRNATKQALSNANSNRDNKKDEMYKLVITDRPAIRGVGVLNLYAGTGNPKVTSIDQRMVITSENQELIASIVRKREEFENTFTLYLSPSFADISEQGRKNEIVALLFFSRLKQHLYGEDLLQRDYTNDVLDDFKIAHIDGNKYPLIVLP